MGRFIKREVFLQLQDYKLRTVGQYKIIINIRNNDVFSLNEMAYDILNTVINQKNNLFPVSHKYNISIEKLNDYAKLLFADLQRIDPIE
jgi:hypothetical protein